MANPILIETTRGTRVESWHRGALVLARPDGTPVLVVGNTEEPTYPRSAIKPLQAIPFVESGAVDRLRLGTEQIALACASHSGMDRHVTLVRDMLRAAGLGPEALACGAQEPISEPAARQLAAGGASPAALHNNCSGKHAAMLATAVHLGEPPGGYWRPEHPVQRRVRDVLVSMTGDSGLGDRCGIDGCSLPNWAVPLTALATAYARLVSGMRLERARRDACARIAAAMWAEPDLVAGPERLNTVLLARFRGRLSVKSGAEGVYCGAFPDLGMGFALKVDDGTKRAAEAVVSALVSAVLNGGLPRGGGSEPLTNWRGLVVGEIRPSEALVSALQGAPTAPR